MNTKKVILVIAIWAIAIISIGILWYSVLTGSPSLDSLITIDISIGIAMFFATLISILFNISDTFARIETLLKE
ncbi:MAG: hypothetical protein QMD22_01265 [archaeon]|nr:hypothetical protein [archaeon]